MKRSEVDRFVADSSSHEQEVSAEVYLIVTAGGHCRAALVRWRYLALALAIFAAAAAILATNRESDRARSRSSSASVTWTRRSARSIHVTRAAPTPAASCVDVGGYGGLGGRISAFDANNNESTGPGGPSPGNAFYVVTATAKGCVTAFAVQDSTTPPLTARGLLVLVSHPFLPSDSKQVVDTDRCDVWKSRALMRATGRAYARATAIAQGRSIPGTAQIAATSDSSC
jgi:hypothetical protein